MANTVQDNKIKSKFNVKRALIITEQLALYTAIVAGLGFYAGTQFNARQTADRQAAIHDAVKAAATPAAVATSKN